MEEFRKIKNYENYSISNLGNVRNDLNNKILKQSIRCNNGYMSVHLTLNNKQITNNIHILIANAFIDNPDNKLTVDHIDQNKLNNSLSNLRFSTQSEQCMNRSKMKNNVSGITGVYKTKKNKYKAVYGLNYKNYNIGTFDTIDEATKARVKKVNEIFGSFTSKVEKIKMKLYDLNDELEELELEFISKL